MGEHGDEGRRREQLIENLQGYASGQSELGREFARHEHMHVTDSAAIVEILRAEGRGLPLTPARLAERVGLSSGATSILLNRLEDAGHVARRRGHSDRRLVTLHSTPSVHASADAFFSPLRARIDELMDRYTIEQLDLVDEFVTDMRRAVENHLQNRPG
ncbi:MarR family transcriptional regulator [Actinomycetospora sp. NBRC 106378]|uniref:MarR family transcriptional regulator n=1 Tax=Actinomycetospora sp. NBRC 106378 TaxID=3032208 RepID=UPI0024A41A38|nr:MarR family transcriptional regulator [Actinomycetospora sp. NBRC 106378]GLZ53799.1 hypothetical protein Acsp07_34160 [Actinomycetospora sp. NBRC 106378]